MQYSNKNRFKIRIIAVIFLVPLLILAGCLAPSGPTEPVEICPTSANNTPEPKGGTPRLIVVLIKEHPEYKVHAFRALDILGQTFAQKLQPGDRVIMLSMEQPNLKHAVFFDGQVEYVEKPPELQAPVAPPTVGSLPPPTSIPQGGYMESVATQDTIRYLQGTKIAATRASFEYECAVERWNQGNNIEWEKWNRQKQKAISKFMNDFHAKIEENKAQGFHTPVSQVFEAVQIASSILNSECSKYAECKLVIFTDFYDYRNFQPIQSKIVLPDIEIASVLLDCQFTSECQERILFWEKTFNYFGASELSHFALSSEAEATLLTYLGR